MAATVFQLKVDCCLTLVARQSTSRDEILALPGRDEIIHARPQITAVSFKHTLIQVYVFYFV